MDLQEALQQLVVLELNKAQAAAAPAPIVTKADESASKDAPGAPVFDMDALVEKLSEALTPKVEALVEKALPAVPERGEGTGRAVPQGEGAGAASDEPKSIEELVAKAGKGHDKLSEDEKKAIWKLTHGLMSAGLSRD